LAEATPTGPGAVQANEEVFISYSHDSPEHIKYVLDLSNRLRADGIDCVLDQYETSPPEGWPRWMDRKIREAKNVMMICTDVYFRRVMGEEKEGVGFGVKWEGNLIYQHLYDSGTRSTKFVPVVLDASQSHLVPTPLRGATIYTLGDDDGYERLYARLAGIPAVAKPPLGQRRPLAKKPVKTNPAMYITSPIDVDLWNQARWSGTFFMHYPQRPPILGLGFRDESAARKIFEGWHERYGDRDLDEELRIAIIEGDVPGEDPGYSIHISTDMDVFLSRLRTSGYEYDEDLVFSVSRINRMNPPAESPNLDRFKEHYREFKTYLLAPGIIGSDGKALKPLLDLAIYKGRIHFRHVSEVRQNDIDTVVLGTGRVDRGENSFGSL
jgi:hypothetical protein